MLKVKATITSVCKLLDAIISNVQSTHKDSKLFMRSLTDVLFVVGLVPLSLMKFSNCRACAVEKARKMGTEERSLHKCRLIRARRRTHLHAEVPSALMVIPEIIVPEVRIAVRSSQ